MILALLLELLELVPQLFVLALQLLHLRLQRIELVDEFDATGLCAALPLLLFEPGHAFGQAFALGMHGKGKCNGGHEGRRACETSRNH